MLRLAHSCPKHGGKPPCQDIKFAAAASSVARAKHGSQSAAVRSCSTSSWRRRNRIPDPAASAPVDLFPCPPARWSASSLAGQLPGADRARGAVAGATAVQLRCNRLATEIIGLIATVAPVADFPRASCVCAWTRAHVRIYTRENAQPCNHSYISTQYQIVTGYSEVAQRLQLQPFAVATSDRGGKAREFNIIEGRYRSIGCASILIGLMRGRKGGRSAKTFGPVLRLVRSGQRSGPASSSCSADLDQGARAQGRNGGFLRVCGVGSGPVGTGRLEQWAERRRNARFSACRRKLGRLTGTALAGRQGRAASIDQGDAWARSAERGGRPPRAARLIPRPFAHAIFPDLDPASIDLIHDRAATVREGRQGSNWPTGSGEASRVTAAQRGAGRGCIAGLEVRRSSETSGRRAHVN